MAGKADSEKVINSALPEKSFLREYGPHMGIFGVVAAVLEFLGHKPDEAFKLLAQFGPKWLFFTFVVVVVYSLLRQSLKIMAVISKRGLDLLKQGVDNLGTAAVNIGHASVGVNDAAQAMKAASAKTDAIQQEMQLQIGYVSSQGRDTLETVRMVSNTQLMMQRALTRIEDKMGITPDLGAKP